MRPGRNHFAFAAAFLLSQTLGCREIVPPPPVAAISLSDSTADLVVSETLLVEATPRDGLGAPLLRPIKWTTSSISVASVENGLVTGLSPGTAIIAAESEGISAKIVVTVDDGGIVTPSGNLIFGLGGQIEIEIPPAAVSQSSKITMAEPQLVPVNKRLIPGTAVLIRTQASLSQPVTLVIKYDRQRISGSEAGLQLHEAISGRWVPLERSDVDFASHTVRGQISGGGVFAILAQADVESVGIVATRLNLEAGDSAVFLAVVKDEDGRRLDGRMITWETSNSDVLQIDPVTGHARALAPGTSSIIASCEGKKGTATVIVTAGPASNIAVSTGDQQSAQAGSPVAIAPSVKVTDKYGFAVARAEVTFEVASGGGSVSPSIAVTDSAGLAGITRWTLGRLAGANSLRASLNSGASVTFTASAIQPAPLAVRIVTFGDSNTDAGWSGTNLIAVATSYVSVNGPRAPPNSHDPTQLAAKLEARWRATSAVPFTAVNHGISGTGSGAGRTGSDAPNAREVVAGTSRFDAEVLGAGYPWNGGEGGPNFPSGPVSRVAAFIPGPNDFAYVSIGTNDPLHGLTAQQTATNLNWMIDRWVSTGHQADHFILTTLAPRPSTNGAIVLVNQQIRDIAGSRGVFLIDIAQRTSDDNGGSWRSVDDHVGDYVHYSESVRDWIAQQVVAYMAARVLR